MPDTMQSITENPTAVLDTPATPCPRGQGGTSWVPVSLSETVGKPGQSLHPQECCGTILTAGPGGPTGPGGPAMPSLPGKPIKPWQRKSRECPGAVAGKPWGLQGPH